MRLTKEELAWRKLKKAMSAKGFRKIMKWRDCLCPLK